MQVSKTEIEKNLSKKGFVKEKESHHIYLHHEHNGLRAGIHTYVSHGSKLKTYGRPLLKRIKEQLKLDSITQVVDLIKCPLNEKKYNNILGKKGFLK